MTSSSVIAEKTGVTYLLSANFDICEINEKKTRSSAVATRPRVSLTQGTGVDDVRLRKLKTPGYSKYALTSHASRNE